MPILAHLLHAPFLCAVPISAYVVRKVESFLECSDFEDGLCLPSQPPCAAGGVTPTRPCRCPAAPNRVP